MNLKFPLSHSMKWSGEDLTFHKTVYGASFPSLSKIKIPRITFWRLFLKGRVNALSAKWRRERVWVEH